MSGNEPEASPPMPPDEWFIDSYARGDVCVNFYDIDGKVEAIPATWMENNIFWLDETPLRVNGVSIEDQVEVEWRGNEITPYFVRIKEKSTFRTIRVLLGRADATNKRLMKFLENNTYSYRIHQDVLAFSVYRDDDDPVLDWVDLMEWMRAEFDLEGQETDSLEGPQSPT